MFKVILTETFCGSSFDWMINTSIIYIPAIHLLSQASLAPRNAIVVIRCTECLVYCNYSGIKVTFILSWCVQACRKEKKWQFPKEVFGLLWDLSNIWTSKKMGATDSSLALSINWIIIFISFKRSCHNTVHLICIRDVVCVQVKQKCF